MRDAIFFASAVSHSAGGGRRRPCARPDEHRHEARRLWTLRSRPALCARRDGAQARTGERGRGHRPAGARRGHRVSACAGGQRVAPSMDLRRREEQGGRLPPSRGSRELRPARRRGHACAPRRGRPPPLGREEPPRGRGEQEDARLDAARGRGREARVHRRVREAPAAARTPARQPPAPPLQGELAARGRDARRARRDRQRGRVPRPPQEGPGDHHARGRRPARRADAPPRAREVRERGVEAVRRRARRGASPRSGRRCSARGAAGTSGRGQGAERAARPVAGSVGRADDGASQPGPSSNLAPTPSPIDSAFSETMRKDGPVAEGQAPVDRVVHGDAGSDAGAAHQLAPSKMPAPITKPQGKKPAPSKATSDSFDSDFGSGSLGGSGSGSNKK